MSLEHRRPIANAGRPDLGFQAAFGFYLGLVAGGLVAFVGLLADVTTPTLLGALPTTVTAVTIAGHVAAKRSHGLPDRIGRRRRLRVACYLPAVGFAAAAAAPFVTPFDPTTRYVALLIGFTAVVGVAGFGLASLCRRQFVEAITTDEPTTTWTYRPAGLFHAGGVLVFLMAFFVLAGAVMSAATGSVRGLFWVAFGVVMIVWTWVIGQGENNSKKYYGKRFKMTAPSDVGQGELRAHERGVRHDQGRSKRLVPWTQISDIRLIDDELVLERRFRNLRCDREAIDEPEAVYESLLEVRERATESN
jgi:hypothetical protein